MTQRTYKQAERLGCNPLHEHEVPSVEALTTDELMRLYMSDETVGLSCADALWYFRPWRNDRPVNPGVYARFLFRDIYNGYAYYTGADWLMAESTPKAAGAVGMQYEQAVLDENWQSARFLISNHQNCLWSEAPLEGLWNLRTPTWADNYGKFCKKPGELRHELALLRYALDPLRRTTGLGELLA